MDVARRKFGWPLLIALYAIYASAFVARTSFVVDGQRYFCLLDDAMITLRFGQNIAAGEGALWNPGGARVEGFTSPLWTLLLAGICCLGCDTVPTCLIVQLLGIPCMVGIAWATVRLARVCRYPPGIGYCAAGWVLLYFNLNHFALWGMETGLAVLVVTLGLGEAIRRVREGEGTIASLWWVGPAVLLRPELAALAAYVGGLQLVFLRRKRWRTVVGLGMGVGIVAAYVAWRHAYFGAWLPNTYTLKVAYWPWLDRLHAALRYLPWTLVSLGPCLLLATLAAPSWRRPQFWLLLVLPILALGYQIQVGGDHFPHDRYVLPVVPALLILTATGLARLARLITILLNSGRRRSYLGFGVLCVFLCMNAPNLHHVLLIAPTRSVPAENRANVQSALAIERHSDPEAVVALVFAGTVPCFVDRTYVDLLGKCDAHIAHLPAHPGLWAGHNKFDYAWSLANYEPDVIDAIGASIYAEPSVRSRYRVHEYLVDRQQVWLLVRTGSSRVRPGLIIPWHQIDELTSAQRGQ